MAEKLMVAKSRVSDSNQLVLCATRYGNVMASRGSVSPLFVDQLLARYGFVSIAGIGQHAASSG